MNRISRFLGTVLLLAGWGIAWPAAAQPACHDDAARAAEQRALDETQIAELLRDRPALPTPARLQAILDQLVAVSPGLSARAPTQLLVVDDRELNAFAADHGVVILTRALLDPRHGLDDDELAAVIAHELAHVEVRDALAEACEMMLRVGDANTRIAQVRARLATLNPASALGRNAVELLQEQELLADARGIALLRLAGRDTHAMARVLAKLHAPQLPGLAMPGAATHPELRERLERAKSQAGR
jgi:predicted Zn-dependent protease